MADKDVVRSDAYVYALIRPDTGEPFYIGKGTGDRWRHHIRNPERQNNRHKTAIIRKLAASGLEVEHVKLIEGASEQDALRFETFFILAIGRRPFGPLVNLTNGGEGFPGHVKTEEHKAAIAAALRGKPKSPSHKKACAQNALKAREGWKKVTKEARAAATAKRLASVSPEVRSERQKIAWGTRVRNNPQEAERMRAFGKINLTSERRMAGVAAAAARSPEARSEAARKANASRTPEQRAENIRKAWETRRRKKALADGNTCRDSGCNGNSPPVLQ